MIAKMENTEIGRAVDELLMMGQTFRDTRITDRDEFSGRKALEVGPSADTADTDYRCHDPEEFHREKWFWMTM